MSLLSRLAICAVPYCFVLLLTGCGGKTVTLVDEEGFDAMARRAAPVLKEREILDSDGSYAKPMLAFFSGVPSDAGKRLAHRLSPAFRFQESDPALLPATFADAKGIGDKLLIGPYGFVLDQGDQRVAVSLLGMTEWDKAATESWFAQCRVNNKRNSDERVYYLVIPNPEAKRYEAQVLAIYDCRGGRCRTYLGAGNASLLGEEVVIDLLPGQQVVTEPPRM